MVSLTEAINKAPYAPSFLGRLGLFQPRPVRTTKISIEDRQGKLALISTAARDTVGDVRSRPRRTIRDFTVPHVPYYQTIMADDVQNIRTFGSETEMESVGQVVNEALSEMRADHEVTHEWHRIGAIKGEVLDADGSTVLYDYFTEFGTSEINIDFDFASGVADLKLLSNNVIKQMGIALGATPFTGVLAICGGRFFDAVTTHASVKDGYERWQSSKFFRESQIGPEYNADVNGFDFAGITWVTYRGQVGNVQFMHADQCRFVPLGVRGMFLEVMAPANFIETVNTSGRLLYAKQRRLDYDTGIELHTQSNVLYVPTRPRALIKGTGSNFSSLIPADPGGGAYYEEIQHSARPGDKIRISGYDGIEREEGPRNTEIQLT